MPSLADRRLALNLSLRDLAPFCDCSHEALRLAEQGHGSAELFQRIEYGLDAARAARVRAVVHELRSLVEVTA